jgi:uncharacterized protein
MQYLMIALDSTDNGAPARRASARDEHRSQPTMVPGRRLIFAATLVDDKGEARGPALAFEVDSRQDLDVYLAGEPYLRDEVWQSVEVFACVVPDAFPGSGSGDGDAALQA